jgi:pimeloyl-ACP methyl ester carboxylesterase
VTVSDEIGSYHYYAPATLETAPDVVVLVHGTPGKQETALDTARYYVENWINLAQEQGCLLLAPAFDDANFSSKHGDQALGGYRGLFGRQIGADEFVLGIVERYSDSKFYLYGHSAGGQFVARFIVKHPQRVQGAVISAAATYPQPDPDVPWPFGLGALHTTLQWHNPGSTTEVAFTPNPDDWLAAAALPVTVIVGLNDLEWQPGRTGQKGNTRVAIANNWVRDVNQWAAELGGVGNIQLSLVPNLGHSSFGLLPYSQQALFDD